MSRLAHRLADSLRAGQKACTLPCKLHGDMACAGLCVRQHCTAEWSKLSLMLMQGNLRGPDGGQRVVLKRVKQRVQASDIVF